MILFGIDPGSAVTGFGVIRVEGNCISWVDCGVIRADAKRPLPEKLVCMYEGLVDKMREHRPQRVCIEEAFYAKNVHTTLILGQARGVALLAAVQSGAAVAEYSPREIKKSVVGNGNAEKSQVEFMIKALLSLKGESYPADAYDALAAAVCDFRHCSFSRMLGAKAGKNHV
jgi:crossover junction endodeoxyribonuclease RuvC